MHAYRTHTCGALRLHHAGQAVRLSGWIHRMRDHGGLLFVDLRDHYGLTQLLFRLDQPETSDVRGLGLESVITATGTVAPRSADNVNASILTGKVEVQVASLEVLSDAEPLPFPVADERPVSESARLQHRFLDLRRQGLHRRIQLRAEVIGSIRRRLVESDFTEIPDAHPHRQFTGRRP